MKQKITFLVVALFVNLISFATPRFFVSASSGSDTNDGTSWELAYATIQPAITSAYAAAISESTMAEVWVQQGTYNISTSLIMSQNVNVYGGFSGSETLLSQRTANPALTIVDAGGLSRVLSQTSASFTEETVWDGFTFQNGYYESTSATEAKGGGAVVLEKKGKLSNCIIKNSSSNIHGAGVFMNKGGYLKDCVIENNTIIVNTYGNARQAGGGVYVNSDPDNFGVIENCEVKNNHIAGEANTGSKGGGVYLSGGEIRNSLVTDNSAYQGGGVYAYSANLPGPSVISDCKILNNLSYHNGGGIYTSVLSTDVTPYTSTIINCLIANNTGLSGGGIQAANSVSTREYGNRIINCTIVRNTTTGTSTTLHSVYSQNANFFMNTIIWGNSSEGTTNKKQFYAADHAFARFINCAIQDLIDPTDFTGGAATKVVRSGLIALAAENTTDVMFSDPSTTPGVDGTGWETADWTIGDVSLCYKAGAPSYADAAYTASAPTTEISGISRPSSPFTPSIGAYENSSIYTSSTNDTYNQKNLMVIHKDIITTTAGLIKVYNLSGHELISKQIDGYLSTGLTAGVYIARFVDNEGRVSALKFIIK